MVSEVGETVTETLLRAHVVHKYATVLCCRVCMSEIVGHCRIVLREVLVMVVLVVVLVLAMGVVVASGRVACPRLLVHDLKVETKVHTSFFEYSDFNNRKSDFFLDNLMHLPTCRLVSISTFTDR